MNRMTTKGQKVGYIRVSSIEQNTESQKSLLGNVGMDKVFEEKLSGKNTARPQLQMMLDYVREGDTVYVKDLSRLARNTKDLLDIVEYLNNKGVGLFSIKENIDTTSNFGKLMITFLAAIYEFRNTKDLLDIVEYLNNKGVGLFSIKENIDTTSNFGKLMITFLAAIYEFERANLLERQRDGIAVAKKQGKYKGRKQVQKPANFSEVYKKWLNREIKSNVAIRELNISEYAFYKFVRESGSRSGVDGNGEFSTTQLNDGDVGTQALPSTTGAEENTNG